MENIAFVNSLRSGKKVFGTLITVHAPKWPEAVAAIGLDFVFIDMEHVALDRTQVSYMCRAYQALDLAPIVRIPSPDPYEASKMLDGGACAIVAPYIEDPEQVRQLVGAVKYKPLKGKKLQEALNSNTSLESELLDYVREHNAGKALIVNIESVPAMEALDEILEVEGLDAILIGPHDLSCSLGIPEQYQNEKFIQAVEETISKGIQKGIGVGIHVTYHSGLQQEIAWAQNGVNLIIHSADIIAFQNAMHNEINAFKSTLDHVDLKALKNMNI